MPPVFLAVLFSLHLPQDRTRIELDINAAGMVSLLNKIGGVADSKKCCQKIQRALDQLEEWTVKWQMEFSPIKCEDECKGNVYS